MVDSKRTIPEAEEEISVSDGLVIIESDGEAFFVCRKCRTIIQNANKNYKSGCIKKQTDIQEVGLSPIDPKLFIDDEIVFREYFCPSCGLLFQGDFAREEDDDFWDIRLFLNGFNSN